MAAASSSAATRHKTAARSALRRERNSHARFSMNRKSPRQDSSSAKPKPRARFSPRRRCWPGVSIRWSNRACRDARRRRDRCRDRSNSHWARLQTLDISADATDRFAQIIRRRLCPTTCRASRASRHRRKR